MAVNPALLDCPLCDFTVLPSDVYILRLHFEQVHTTDSPFIVEDDPEVQPPALPPRPSSAQTPVPSSDEDDNTVECPEPDCGETVLLSDYNDHLDYHSAETLSFDETTGKYHSHPSAATMQGLADALYSQKGHTDTSLLDNDSSTDISSAQKKSEGRRRKVRRRTHRERSNTDSSEKSTLSRSILSFNPFTKHDKVVKPPSNSARLGVRGSLPFPHSLVLTSFRNPNLDHMPGKNKCPNGYTISLMLALRLPSSIESVVMGASSNKSKCRTRHLE